MFVTSTGRAMTARCVSLTVPDRTPSVRGSSRLDFGVSAVTVSTKRVAVRTVGTASCVRTTLTNARAIRVAVTASASTSSPRTSASAPMVRAFLSSMILCTVFVCLEFKIY